MYDKIVNPSTGRKVSIYGKLGRNIIRNYMVQFGGAGNGVTWYECDIEGCDAKVKKKGAGDKEEHLKRHKADVHNIGVCAWNASTGELETTSFTPPLYAPCVCPHDPDEKNWKNSCPEWKMIDQWQTRGRFVEDEEEDDEEDEW